MKRMITQCWLAGDKKLASGKIGLLCKRLEELASKIPCEFQRSTRSLQLISLWKGTEFRMFCLYFGILVTFGILSDELHKHFILLVVSLRILHDPFLMKTHIGFAREWLQEFFKQFGDYYDLESLTLNVHSIMHLPDDIAYFQCSPNQISAFLFESFLGKMKKRMRQGNKPLQQLCNRLDESKRLVKKVAYSEAKCTIKKTKNGEIIEIKSDQFTLKLKKPNNVVLLKNGIFFKILKFSTSKKRI